MDCTQIKSILERELSPEHVDVKDDSKKHKHHPGNTGGGHFELVVVSQAFEDVSAIERHRMIYTLLSMPRPEIHALAMKLYTPLEWKKQHASD
ncbi:MAG: BolA family protein [Bdellovibrionota bacterium]